MPAGAIGDVEAEVTTYKAWHGVDGIFVDEVAMDVASLPHYQNRGHVDGQLIATTNRTAMSPQLGSIMLGETAGTSPTDTLFYWDDLAAQVVVRGASAS